ncbi:hypothetical protein FA15DRAFT_581890 [Coprinopsis marcescibilis]|uniref:Nudix hydrolase domain-containing protein n=1 Tax=Coprinopsis marcescibilis TaxID=230819 RepID=A0A5C3L9M1_COPMA|nr:hypothetical protein FA15DRAFT_581890 [Coprinopsis marcescibilis]
MIFVIQPQCRRRLLTTTGRRLLSPSQRQIHHIFPAPQPLRYPEGYTTLLPIVLAANNLVLPPTAEFDRGYLDRAFSAVYNAKGRPLNVASRTPYGGFTSYERVVPFFVSHQAPHKKANSDDPNIVYNTLNNPNIQNYEPHTFAPKPIGWLIPEVAAAISRDHLRHFQRDSASPWDIRYFDPGELDADPVHVLTAFDASNDDTTGGRGQMVKSVAFADWINEGGRHARTMHVERLLLDWKRKKVFAEVLKGWSEEPYPVFNHPTPGESDPLAFAIDRAALPIFGLANYGALLTAYIHDPSTNETKLWIPQRSKHKTNSPGRLDVTAGGGMRLGDTPLTTILREASEEALLDIDYLTEFLKPVGTVPYLHRSPHLPSLPLPQQASGDSHQNAIPEHRPIAHRKPHTFSLSEHPNLPTSPLQQHYILPGHYYLYELSLPVDLTVSPQLNILDGEFAAFHLLPIHQVLENLLQNKFKRSSALATIDFLVRGGWVNEENDSCYTDVVRVLRGGLGGGGSVPVPWRSFGL